MFKTSRLLLRKIVPEDQEHIFRGLSDPVVTEHYGVRYDTLEATSEQMQWYRELEKSGKGIWWAICKKEDHEFIGACGFNSRNSQHQRIEIGFWLLPACWGKGFLQESAPAIIEYAFETLDIHRIEAWVESANLKSKKLLQNLDFSKEGKLKDYEKKGSSFFDVEIYARFRSKVG